MRDSIRVILLIWKNSVFCADFGVLVSHDIVEVFFTSQCLEFFGVDSTNLNSDDGFGVILLFWLCRIFGVDLCDLNSDDISRNFS